MNFFRFRKKPYLLKIFSYLLINICLTIFFNQNSKKDVTMLSCLDPDPDGIRKTDPDPGVKIALNREKLLYLTSLNYPFSQPFSIFSC
jgi:hypothetical protein